MPPAPAYVEVHMDAGHVLVLLEDGAHPLDAVLATGYRFVGRGFLHLSRPQPGAIAVRLTPRTAPGDGDLDGLAEEFVSLLAEQVTRQRLADGRRRIREYTTAAALHEVLMARPSAAPAGGA